MTTLQFHDQRIDMHKDESVLDALLRSGIPIAHGCRAGVCQSCLLRCIDGEIAPPAQAGLAATLRQQDAFLSCRCIPTGDLVVSDSAPSLPRVKSRVLETDRIAPRILRIRLAIPFDFRPGQYLNIWLDEYNLRSYSIASCVDDGYVELHVGLIEGGRFSEWAIQHLASGHSLNVQGPFGTCHYDAESEDQPLLLIGMGTGLAPLYGIVKESLLRGHRSPIDLVTGARNFEQFYLQDELLQLCDRAPNLQAYWVAQHQCNQQAQPATNLEYGDIYQFVARQFVLTRNTRIYLCGAESFVHKMKKQCYLHGAALQNIRADAFLPCS